MKEIIIQDKVYKQFRDTKYYCDQYGEIYSAFSKRILKPMTRTMGNKTYQYIDVNFGSGMRHTSIHRIVYETWIGKIPEGQQVNHLDDNSLNNHYKNLYAGTQKQNIQDCLSNGHRVGNMWILTIYDKEVEDVLTFCPASDFIQYSGHSCKNGGVKRMFPRMWFQKRYEIIEYKLCKNLEEKNSVTTIP